MMEIDMLGVRGSMGVSGKGYQTFGVATSCVRVLAGEQEIYLDAGTGILAAKPLPDTAISILFTHAHLDHLLGLPFFAGMNCPGRPVDLYMKHREGGGIREALDGLFRPPYWPVGIFDLPADSTDHDLGSSLELGEVLVDVEEGYHPGGASLFRIRYHGTCLVFATDLEYDRDRDDRLEGFMADADLLICDGQYTKEEYPGCRGYGHSTPQDAARLAGHAGVKQLVITHHAPGRSDEELLAMEADARESFRELSFAREGDHYTL